MKLFGPILTPVAVVAMLLPLSGCLSLNSNLAAVQVWAVPESAVVPADAVPELENETYTDAGRAIRVASAVNEIVSLQIVLRGGKSGANVREFSCTDLRQSGHVIPAAQVHLYRELRVPVTEYPAWFLRLTPDLRARREYAEVLVPLSAPKGALPIELKPGRAEAVWMDIAVPPGTQPGLYQGKLRIGGGGGAARELGLTLEVWGFALPQTRHLALVAGVSATELLRQHVEVGGQAYAPARLSIEDPAYKRSLAVIEDALRLLHEHRLSPVLTDVYPLTRLRGDGRPELDWADYDRLVTGAIEGTLFDDRAAATAWPLPISNHNPPPETFGGWGSPAHREAMAEYLRQSTAHFREKGWFDRHFVWIRLPGADRGEQYDEFDQLARVLNTVEPRVDLLCTLTPQSMAPYGLQNDPFHDETPLVGTWCPPASMADPAQLERVKAAGKGTWFTPDRAPFAGSLSLIAPGLHPRTIPWQAYRFGCTGVFLPAVNQWASDGQPRVEGSESALIWPGKPFGLTQPVASVRLKRLLRGMEDYEYLWLLEKNRRPAVAHLIAGDLFAYGGTLCYGEHYLDGRPNGWASDQTAWSLARRLMARELLAAMAEEQSGAPEKVSPEEDVIHFEQQIEWARLTEAVRGVRAEVEGVRVDLDPRNTRAPVKLAPVVCVFNGTREPFAGRLTFGATPQDWNVEGLGTAIEKLDPRRWARRSFSANVPALTTNADGVLDLHVSVGRENAEPTLWPARVCALTSYRLNRPLTLDGRLDDWPRVPTNAAGDFVLVGARDVPKQGTLSPDRPSQGTLVFVCHDREYLYIGFNCTEARPAERVISRGNTVQYDDLWPVGEDLVEVVLDPTHRAIDSGGLLHFVVKANGAVISEQGVPCLAGVSRYSDWPAGVEAKLDDTSQKDRWTVEIRIPLKALAGKPGVWGVNFGRFNARLGEYSSWSGARRFLYSPASLGNLRVE